jgi:hypothetical protein
MSKAYITPTGAGRADGSSWANAAKLGSINTMIAKVGPGGEVLVRADMGAYQLKGPVEIVRGGTSAGDVTIRGVDVNEADMLVHMKGTRMDVYTPGGAAGLDGLRLLTGANHLNIENFKLEDMGRAIHVGSAIKDLKISNVVGENVQRLFDNDFRNGPTGDATITGLVIEDVTVHGFSKNAIRLSDNTNDVVIRNVVGDSERQDMDNFAMGVQLTDTVNNVLIENTTMRNAHSSLGGYWNGDGFVTERGVHNVRFVNTVATGSTDAGYDLKSTDTVLIGAYAADNKRNYRIWSDSITIIDSVSVDVHNRGGSGGTGHIQLATNAAVTLVNMDIYESNPRRTIFDVAELGARITLDDVNLYAGPDVRLMAQGVGSSVRNVDGSLPTIQPMPPGGAPGEFSTASIMQVAPEPSVLSISASHSALGEGQFGQTAMTFTVTRTGPVDKDASVAWSVEPSGASGASAQDFVGDKLPGGAISFAAGETAKEVVIFVKAERLIEADESFTVTLASPVNGKLGQSAAQMTILNDDPQPVGITTIGQANSIDLTSGQSQIVTGTAQREMFFVRNEAVSGRDTIANFGKDDVLVTTRLLNDSNNDGLITFSRNLVNLDGRNGNDIISFTNNGLKALRNLGATDDGLNVYADASVRPARSIEGGLGDDALRGDVGDRQTNRFFFDTALDLDLGNDEIANFGMRDLIVTTTRLADVGGAVALAPNGKLELPGGTGGLRDGYFAGEGGSVTLKGLTGAPVAQLEYDGAMARNGVTYHVYSMTGSQAGLADF